MASKDEEPFNTETDEETMALRKKRLRRVSFADREITSVHIFNRDEDYEQESAAEPSSVDEDNMVLGFFRDLAADSDDSREMSPEGDDDEETASSKSFLRPIETPSPGSSIIGSATSNDGQFLISSYISKNGVFLYIHWQSTSKAIVHFRDINNISFFF